MPVGEDAFDEGPPNNGRFRGRVVLEVFTPFGVGIALEVAERLKEGGVAAGENGNGEI